MNTDDHSDNTQEVEKYKLASHWSYYFLQTIYYELDEALESDKYDS